MIGIERKTMYSKTITFRYDDRTGAAVAISVVRIFGIVVATIEERA